MNLFDKLNEKQCEAVRTTEGFVRVIAGAGSGKTKLLVSRYAYLVQEYGIDSANILCVTFTNKAAGEMKKRIRALIGPEYDTSLICTYHGFCARLLREDPEKLFFTKGFQIIDTSQQKAILEDIYQKHELKLDYASFENILKKINFVKSRTDYVPRFCNPKPCQIMAAINNQDDQIIEEFMQRQKAVYSLDFSDLMSFALYLLETDAEIREKWQDRLNYIQVDEFQDSSKRELALVDILSGKYKNLMIVGDPDQNIYEWRGSDVKLLVDFDKTHNPTETIFLNQNYRSTPQILRCANHLIEKNELRLKKDLFTKSENGAVVTHFHSKSDDAENTVIVDNIRSLKRTKGYSYSDFAVLYRSGFLSRVIEKKFVENNIPYEIYGGVKFYQRMEILDIIAYLRLIAFDDDVSFKRIINTPRRKFGRSKMAYLETLKDNSITVFDTEEEKSFYKTLKYNLNESVFRASGAGEFVNFIDTMRQFSESARISEIVNRVTVESGYEQYIRELGDEERLENLSEFKRIANEFERSFGENLTLSEFLMQIALQSGEDEEKPREAVKLMTIHSAKGLEFPVVFIVGFTEGIFPSSKTIEERKKLGLEEERRLCYVAITRAKEYLFIMDSEGMSEKGIKKLPSRFLNEIGVENYTRIGKISDDLMREAYGYIRRNTPPPEPKEGIGVGSDVVHHAFGHGKIVGIDEKRGSYVIKFDKLSQTRTISRGYFDRPHDALENDPPAVKTEIIGKEEAETDLPAKEIQSEESVTATSPSAPVHSQTDVAEPSPVLRYFSSENGDRLSYDQIFVNNMRVANGNGAVSAKKKLVDGSNGNIKTVAMHGWFGNQKMKINSYGYTVDGGEPVYGAFAKYAERQVIAAGGESRFTIVTDVSGYQDGAIHKMQAVVKLENGDVVILNKNENGEERDVYLNYKAPLSQTDTERPGSEELEEMDRFTKDEVINSVVPGQPAAPSSDSAQTGEPEPEANDNKRQKQQPVISDELRKKLAESENLWKRDDVPHTGWTCIGVTDLGEPCGICEMCGYQIIRYVHHMVHPHYRQLNVGCICAGKMEGDVEAAKKREQEFKNKQSRRENFLNRKWKESRNGNAYAKIKEHLVVLYRIKNSSKWKYSLDNEFCVEVFESREAAVDAAFEALDKVIYRN